MKILIWIVMFLFAVIFCSIAGNYAGGALYFYLSGVPVSQVTWWTLYHGVHLPFKHPDFAYAIWGAALTAWIIFLPVLITFLVLWLSFMPKNNSLYGNAKFANNKELEPLHYKGDYN